MTPKLYRNVESDWPKIEPSILSQIVARIDQSKVNILDEHSKNAHVPLQCVVLPDALSLPVTEPPSCTQWQLLKCSSDHSLGVESEGLGEDCWVPINAGQHDDHRL